MAGTKEPLYQWKHTNIILFFAGENITVNRPKYVMDKSIDFELDQFLKNIINKAPLRWMPPG